MSSQKGCEYSNQFSLMFYENVPFHMQQYLSLADHQPQNLSTGNSESRYHSISKSLALQRMTSLPMYIMSYKRSMCAETFSST